MPYIHWEFEDKRLEMNKVIKKVIKEDGADFTRVRYAAKEKAMDWLTGENTTARDGSEWDWLQNTIKKRFKSQRAARKSRYWTKNPKDRKPSEALLMNHLLPELGRSPVHIRRTLDQFQYYMTEDTEDRDADQVVSRYFQRCHPTQGVPVMMIDQLWLWILDESELASSRGTFIDYS